MKQQDKKKKQCFIITPIGADNSDIRRHIDGIIDECINPIFEIEYEIIVAHKLSKPGSITNQVVENIYNADIIIANLTDLNPNVMYELAFAHSLRKNVIHIMERDGTALPFDLVTERTIFYTNDFQGAIDLKKKLQAVLDNIKNNPDEKIDNPIYNTLEKIGVEKRIIDSIEQSNGEEKVDILNYIIERLDKIEGKITEKTGISSRFPDDIGEIDILVISFAFEDCNEKEMEDTINNVVSVVEDVFKSSVTLKKVNPYKKSTYIITLRRSSGRYTKSSISMRVNDCIEILKEIKYINSVERIFF